MKSDPGGGSLRENDRASRRIYAVTLHLFCFMPRHVAVVAQQDEVLRVQGDTRVIDVVRRQLNDVMDFGARSKLSA